MSTRAPRRLAWSSVWLAGGMVLAGLALSIAAFVASDGGIHMKPHQVFEPLITLSFSTVGALIAARHPRNPIGWMIAALGFFSALDLLALGYRLYDAAVRSVGTLPGVGLATWLDDWLWLVLLPVPYTFLVLLFPNGRLLSPRWRAVAWACGLGTAALFTATIPPLLDALGVRGYGSLLLVQVTKVMASVGGFLVLVGVLGSLTSLIVRFRQSHGVMRDQLKWLVYAVGLSVFTMVLGNTAAVILPGHDPLQLAINSISLAILMVIVGIGIAIVRHHLYDIDLIINRTLVYGVLTALIAGFYVIAVGSLGSLFQAQGELGISLLATGVVAVGFQPLREQLQRGVNRLMYGERDDPFAVVSRLGERLEGALAPDAMLGELVNTIAQSLKLPYVAIGLGSPAEMRIAASVGQPVTDPEPFLLTSQREVVGQLLIAPRAVGEKFNAPERALLTNIARQAGVAVHAVQLTLNLQRSRVQFVTAREEERRRLRRDLHDGLGPTLAAMHLQAGAVRRLIRNEPETAETMVDELKGELKALVEDIRRLAYELRPPALDELGLVGAIQSLSARMCQADNLGDSKRQTISEHDIHIQATGDFQSLPAAVEVAAYRIVQEALLNSMRHARATHYAVRLDRAEALTLEIEDNGAGLPPRFHAGVGMVLMRERAAELGGWCTVDSPPREERLCAHTCLCWSREPYGDRAHSDC